MSHIVERLCSEGPYRQGCVNVRRFAAEEPAQLACADEVIE